jgi:putative transposase
VAKEGHCVKRCCALLGLSRSGFYAWKARPAKLISAHELSLYRTAKELFRRSRNSLGSRELMKKLRTQGFDIGRAKTRLIMKKTESGCEAARCL